MTDIHVADETGAMVYEGQERRAYTEVERSLASLDKRVAVLEQRQELFERHMHSEHQRLHERLDLLRADFNSKLDLVLAEQRETRKDFIKHTAQEDSDRKALLVKVTWFTVALIVGIGAWALENFLSHMVSDK